MAQSRLFANLFSTLALTSTLVMPLGLTQAQATPKFTTIKRSIEAEQVKGAKVLYWDQMLADDLGIVTERGRVGDQAFEKSVADQIALLIKENPKYVNESVSKEPMREGEPRFVEIELDAHGGSGRAGYIRLKGRDSKDVWVNIKGIGLTGLGNARFKPVGPPLEVYGDHSDGSADLPEGIVEAINAKIAENDLKYGAGRILSLVTINKNLQLENDVKYPLVLIVRAPMRRMDRELAEPDTKSRSLERIAESLAQANTKRIFKGDFVNQSNIGAGGEFVDFGLFTVVNGFVPAINYLKVTPFKETSRLFPDHKLVSETYRGAIGFHLLSQLGLEESRLKNTFGENFRSDKLMSFADRFIAVMYGENKEISAEDSGVEKARELDGNFKLHRLFRTLAYDVLTSNESNEILTEKLYRQALLLNTQPTAEFEANFKAFASSAIALIRQATFEVRAQSGYAERVHKIAEFKNRDVRFLDKRTLREWSVDVMEDYVRTKNPLVVQNAIDQALDHAKLSSNDFSTSQMRVTADTHATYLDLKAYADANGKHGLFNYPEFALLDAQAPRFFRVSTDGKASFATVRGELVETTLGRYYRLTIPHGAMPVTAKVTSVLPLGARATKQAIEITAPPLMLNERLGLTKDFTRVPSLMRTRYGVNIDPVAADSKVVRTVTKPRVIRTCSALFAAI